MKNLRNKVQLIGYLGHDVELKKVGNDNTSLVKFRLGTSETFKDSKGERITDTQWHNIVIWGKLADVVAQYTSKGSEIALEGKLVTSLYEDKDKIKRYTTEIVANDVLFLNSAKKAC